MQSILITLTIAGANTDDFSIFTNADGFTTAIATGISKVDLTTGYTATNVPDGATVIRVQSTNTCTNFVDANITGLTTTTTTTTTTELPWNISLSVADTNGGLEILGVEVNQIPIQPLPPYSYPITSGNGAVRLLTTQSGMCSITINYSSRVAGQSIFINDSVSNFQCQDTIEGLNNILVFNNVQINSLTNVQINGNSVTCV